MRKLLLLLLMPLVVGCDATPDSGSERSYTQSIVREAGNDFEATLITRAEALYPPRDSVLAAAWDPAQVPETGYWFYGLFDGTLIPYAVTGDAVTYYRELVEALDRSTSPPFLLSADLTYRAAVSFHETYTFEELDPATQEPFSLEVFAQVYVVEMELDWSQYCGPVCGMWIEHSRVVVFDASGELLAVFGDGPRPTAVS